ncbi:hypothetical protein TNCV_4354451 [Trichonephila clavipes]|nr:hypothetical protein TNCV_4354451 [Trichonephila clavipes]
MTTGIVGSKATHLLTYEEIYGTIRGTNLKFGRHVSFVEYRSARNEFCGYRLLGFASYEGVQDKFLSVLEIRPALKKSGEDCENAFECNRKLNAKT